MTPKMLAATTAIQFKILGYAARLAEPGMLWLLGAVACTALVGVWSIVRRRGLLRRVAHDLGPRVAPGANSARPAAKLSMQALGLALLAFALSQPQCGNRSELSKRFGIDLVVAIDASRSMLARDVKPDRLSRAKLELSSLIDRLKGDRIGIVVFAGDAFVQCPLTTDYAAAKLFLRAIDPESIPQQGTAIGAALSAAKEVLAAADRGAKAKAVILISDGEDHDSAALEEADEMAQEGIRIFAVGVGSLTGEPIPMLDKDGNVQGYKRDQNGLTVMTKLNDKLLRDLADRTQGKFVHSTTGDLGIGELHDEIDRLDKSEFESRLTVAYEDRFAYAAFPGFLLLLAGALFREGS